MQSPPSDSPTSSSEAPSSSDTCPSTAPHSRRPTISSVASHSSDDAFWMTRIGKPILRMLELAQYSDKAVRAHEEFLRDFVVPALGLAPAAPAWAQSRLVPRFPSFMCDDNTPVELGITWAKGRPAIRFSIECIDHPTELLAHGGVNLRAFNELVARLDASELGDFGTLRTLRDAMTTTTPLCDDVAVSSQAFIAWDLAHDGTTATKVYFMPHARAKATGMSNLEVVDAALRSVGMDECAGWQATKSYIASLEVADRPEVLILSTDCVAQGARFKVYLRYPTSEAEEIAQHLSLGGASFSGWREPLDQVFAALGLPTSIGPLNDSEHLTGGTLLYAEFTATSSRPSSKVYLPVRHWPQCSDASVAEGIGQLVSQWSGSSSSHGLDIEGGYPAALASLFPDRDLASRGVHNYVCIGQKHDGRLDISAYHNPQLFTPLPLQPSAVSLAAASTQTCEALKLPAVTQSEELPRDAAAPRAVEAPLPTTSPSSLPAAPGEKVRDSPLRRFRMAARLSMLMRRGVARWQQRSQSAAPVQA